MSAKSRYDYLASDRSNFLNVARQAADLTLPYLNRGEEEWVKGARHLPTPWQSVGAKGVVTLASKLMLALLPPQTSFFKLQVNDSALGTELPPEAKSELDLSFAKIERIILESIAASSDRVVVHQALKHLVVTGNALVFMGEKQLKLYPLNRYVVERDGNGNVLEIVTKERISKKLLMKVLPMAVPNDVAGTEAERNDEADIYTHIRRDNNRFVWHQEYEDKIIPGSMGKAPIEANPWLVLRFNTVDGEVYGRGRVEEFIGDLRSLEALSQALVEGSAAAAKVVFVVSPSSTTKPATLAQAGNGAIVQGRPDDIGVIQVGKTADFRTAFEMMQQLERRLSEAFLGGLFSLLTTEFLVPYLNRKLNVFQKTGQIPRLPKDIVKPTIVAGVNALGRGQDRESLGSFLQTIAQTMGPEALAKYINSDEVIKRLAAAQGIDVLNLVKSVADMKQEQMENMSMQKDMMLTQQIGQLAKTPLMDPSKNPQAMEMINGQGNPLAAPAPEEQAGAPAPIG